MQRILVTGGAGYIGSHTSLILLQSGYNVVVIDSLLNSHAESISRVQKLAQKPLAFIKGDIRDENLLAKIFKDYKIDAVLHFAGLKAVGESVEHPVDYYSTNVAGTVALCKSMSSAGIHTLVFSSSCTVYGNPEKVPITENHTAIDPTNPYGRSKLMAERVLVDLVASDPNWRVGLLRYFNPIGAHESGQIGEDPLGTPNNLLPYIAQVAVGRLKYLKIFGDNYPTIDGTAVRDYIHVMDLAEGHLAALRWLEQKSGLSVWNLGTGIGYSVLEIVRAFESISGSSVPFKYSSRRSGDVAETFADPTKAGKELGWIAKRDLEDMVRDTWQWQSNYPYGYKSA